MQKGNLNINNDVNYLKIHYLHTKTYFLIENKYEYFKQNWDPYKRLLE